MPVNQLDATCLPGTAQEQQFKSFLDKCRTTKDTQTAQTFLNQTFQKYVEVFDSYRAQFDDLLRAADRIADSASSASMQGVNDQMKAYSAKQSTLKQELEHYRRLSDSAEKSFLEDIYNGTPKAELAPTLQDVALLVFAVGWLFISIVLIAVRWASPGGGMLAGVFTLLLLLLVTICVYGLLKQVA
jgi:hypothetical protein